MLLEVWRLDDLVQHILHLVGHTPTPISLHAQSVAINASEFHSRLLMLVWKLSYQDCVDPRLFNFSLNSFKLLRVPLRVPFNFSPSCVNLRTWYKNLSLQSCWFAQQTSNSRPSRVVGRVAQGWSSDDKTMSASRVIGPRTSADEDCEGTTLWRTCRCSDGWVAKKQSSNASFNRPTLPSWHKVQAAHGCLQK